jgi:hypothetical protein
MEMKVTKPTMWTLGIVTVAAPIVAALLLAKDELLIQVIDSRTARPMTDVVVTNLAVHRTVFAGIPGLPNRFRFRSSERVMLATNGAFRIQRISAKGFLQSEQLSFAFGKPVGGPHLVYDGNGLWQNGYKRLGPGPIEFLVWQPIIPVEIPAEGPVILRLDRNKERFVYTESDHAR